MAGEERLSRDVGILAYLLCTPIVAWMYIDIFNIGKPLNPLLDLCGQVCHVEKLCLNV